MARRIIWTKRAQQDRRFIFLYWNKRNKSNLYSQRLNKLFIRATEFLCGFPEIGRITDIDGVKIKVVEHFLILYEFTDTDLVILSIFDSRQDINKLYK